MKTHLVLSIIFVVLSVYILILMAQNSMFTSPEDLAMMAIVVVIGIFNAYQAVDDIRKIRKERL